MGKTTAISWCDSTVNPIMGCSGCELYPNHCYANALVTRHAGKKGWPDAFTKPKMFLDRVDEALAWKDLTGTERPDKPWLNGMPRIVSVNDLGDSFSPAVTLAQTAKVVGMFSAFANSPHQWLFLTKWPKRMATAVAMYTSRFLRELPRNIWLGVSVTDQKTADARVKELVKIPAAVRFVSAEPMLGRIEFRLFDTMVVDGREPASGGAGYGNGGKRANLISWIILGGESGPNFRTLDIVGLELAVNQCMEAGVRCFVKQDSGQRPGRQGRLSDGLWKVKEMSKWL